jgi:hypothetical protein
VVTATSPDHKYKFVRNMDTVSNTKLTYNILIKIHYVKYLNENAICYRSNLNMDVVMLMHMYRLFEFGQPMLT